MKYQEGCFYLFDPVYITQLCSFIALCQVQNYEYIFAENKGERNRLPELTVSNCLFTIIRCLLTTAFSIPIYEIFL